MKKITVEESKQIMLDILTETDRFCRENGIQYFLIGGTLIGAVRHKGFIPWDDVDIALPRKDYERLCKEFKSYSGNFEIVDYRNRENFLWPMAKIIDNRTVLYENGLKKYSIGVCIDVFPLDNVPDDHDEATNHINKIRKKFNLLVLKHLPVRKGRTFLKNSIVVLSKPVTALFSDKAIIESINKLCLKYYDDENCHYLCNCVGAWGIKELAPKEAFSSAIELEFEHQKFLGPVGYDAWLKSVYGDYMTPPPVEKRETTHSAEAFWKE